MRDDSQTDAHVEGCCSCKLLLIVSLNTAHRLSQS